MFSKVFIAVAAASLALASQCNVGSVQCCNQLQNADSAGVAGILSAIGVNAQNVVGQIGLNCNPIDVIGVGSGAKCSSQPVCCENNNYNGLVNVGCSPVNL